MNRDLTNVPHFVYRYYDADDHPLYIGCTVDIRRREQAHAQKHWWPLVARREVEEFRDRICGQEAEQVAIERESPLFNIRHNGYSERSSEAMLRFREEWARDPSRYDELHAELVKTVDLTPPTWLEQYKYREQWKRTQRRLKQSQFRAARIAEIKARRSA